MMQEGNNLYHHDEEYGDEEMSPTLENLLVLLWLQMLHPELPNIVKERFGTELRNQTLASLRTEISQCIPSLLCCQAASLSQCKDQGHLLQGRGIQPVQDVQEISHSTFWSNKA